MFVGCYCCWCRRHCDRFRWCRRRRHRRRRYYFSPESAPLVYSLFFFGYYYHFFLLVCFFVVIVVVGPVVWTLFNVVATRYYYYYLCFRCCCCCYIIFLASHGNFSLFTHLAYLCKLFYEYFVSFTIMCVIHCSSFTSSSSYMCSFIWIPSFEWTLP